jgi:probable rRNA maturation factor
MILNQQKRVRVNIRNLEDFLRRALTVLRLDSEAATVCLVSDAKIAQWNGTYRGKKKPTDVLSFPAGTPKRKHDKNAETAFSSSENGYLGDIAIAPGVARRNAREAGHTLDKEMRILTLHGLLHLMGYDHETDNGTMERLEIRLRRKLEIG